MSLVICKLDGRRSTVEVNTGEVTAIDFYVVQYDAAVSAVTVLGASGLPAYGDAHPDDSTLKVRHIQVKADDGSHRKKFDVQVDYSNKLDILASPLDKPAEIAWSFQEYSQAFFVDHSDTPK